MASEVTMPQMGADMIEGTVVSWVKAVGERVERGEIIAEIETDKATVELEAFEGGVVLQHVVAEGETVPVGEVIALVGEESELLPEVERTVERRPPLRRPQETGVSAAVQAAEAGATAQALPAPPAVSGNGPDHRLRISPVARRIALDAGLDVRGLSGSGPDGRVLRRDVEAALKTAPASPGPAGSPSAEGQTADSRATTPTPAAAAPAGLSRMRQTIARRMAQSKQTQPHYYLTVDVNMAAALAFRDQYNEVAGEERRATINDLVVKACAVALARHPRFNAEFREDALVLHERINIAIGIALDEGLIAPALVDCGALTLGQIAAASKDLVARARAGRLRSDEYGSGTFTITNLGAFGVEALIGIINPPQAAILGVGSILEKPVVQEGTVVPGRVMKLALSADHRVTDGAEGARFLKEIQGLLESPAGLAL